jgi:hypothetical protein
MSARVITGDLTKSAAADETYPWVEKFGAQQ